MGWLSDGIERLLRAMHGQDQQELWSAYDDCLWRITTSGRAELETVVTKVWEEPYYSLPIPLLVTLCRLFVLESQERTPEVEMAVNFILCHCSQGEKEGAIAKFAFLEKDKSPQPQTDGTR